jgi:uncharacterized protein YdiU (UPF0061 family)
MQLLRTACAQTDGPLERAPAIRRANPTFIPCNHRVEEALSAAVERNDYAAFDTLLNILVRPFDDQPEFAGARRRCGRQKTEISIYKT